MGLFDSVVMPCQNVPCRGEVEFQSKAGECELASYSADDVPIEVAIDIELNVDHNPPSTCRVCGTGFRLTTGLPRRVRVAMVLAAMMLALSVSACGSDGQQASVSTGRWKVDDAQEITEARPTCASVPVPASLEIGEFDMVIKFSGATVISNWKALVYDSGAAGFVSVDQATFFDAAKNAWVMDVVTGTVEDDQMDGLITMHLEDSDLRCIVQVHAGRVQ